MMTWFVTDGAEFSIKNNTLTDMVFQISLGGLIPFTGTVTKNTHV